MSRSRRLNRSASAKTRRRPRRPLGLSRRRRGGPRPGVYARRRPRRSKALAAAAIGGGIGLAAVTGVLLAAVLLVADGSPVPGDGVAEGTTPSPSAEPSVPDRDRGELDAHPSPTPEPSPDEDTDDDEDSADGSASGDSEGQDGGSDVSVSAAGDPQSTQPANQGERSPSGGSDGGGSGDRGSLDPQQPPADTPAPSDPPDAVDPPDDDDECPWWRPSCW